MPWPLFRLSLRSRLYLVCAVLIALLLAPSYYTLRQLAEIRDIAFDLQSHHAAALTTVGRLDASLSELHRLQGGLVSAGDVAERERAAEEMAGALALTRENLGRLAEDAGEGRTREAGAVIDSIGLVTGGLDSLAAGRRLAEARAVAEGALPLFRRGHEALAELGRDLEGESVQAAIRAEEITIRTARTAAAATGLAAGLAVLLALLSVGGITTPLSKLRSSMAAVAGGRFSPPSDLPYGRPDEIGDLTRSFRSMAERLAELDRLKAEFVSIASHELKTPVNVVRGYVEMIEAGAYGAVNEAMGEALGHVREQTDVLRERVDQLLAMSRLEAQGLEIQLAPVQLPELFEEVRRNFAGVAAQKRILFRIQSGPSLPDVALLDRRRIRDELLGNLLGNAFKFTPSGGAIYFKAWAEPGWLIFQIRDTGDGIPAAQLPYIFEKYYQAGHHAGKVGAGLGLAIAREIVEAHGGRISVESEEGEGSVFRVEIPAPARSERSEASPPADRRRRTDEPPERAVAEGSGNRLVVIPKES